MTGGVGKKVSKETLLKLSMMIFWWCWGPGTNHKKITLCVWCYGSKRNSRVVQGCKKPTFFAKTVLVWVTHTRGGGSQKATNDDEGEGGHDTPQNWWCHLWTGPNTVFFPGILHLFWHSSKASGLILNALPNFYVIVQCTLKFFVPECKIALFFHFSTLF